jgi:hypothetical protein
MDFWIHLSTISIGLLIAIGLEQSVVALHHQSERHRLEEDLRLEAKKNVILMDIDNQTFDATLSWLIQLRGKVNAMRESGGKLKFDYISRPKTKGWWFPDAPYWNSAKESAEVGLLPRDEAAMYDLVYVQQNVLQQRLNGYLDAVDGIRRFETRFANVGEETSAKELSNMTPERQARLPFDAPVPDISRITHEDLGEYLVLLNDAIAELLRFHRAANGAYAITRAVTEGAKSDEQLFQMMGGRPDQSPPFKRDPSGRVIENPDLSR